MIQAFLVMAALAHAPAPDGGSALCRADGGMVVRSAEDQEVIDNLELLQHLDETRQLDLLLELSKND